MRSYCLDPSGLADAGTKIDYDKQMFYYESSSIYPPGTIARLFQKFHASQKDEATGVNMYDYIMRSGLYAWDFTQQQAMLNTFYGSIKPLSEKVFDPANSAECNTYRDPRLVIEAQLFKSGSHCLASGARAEPLYVSPVGTR